MKKLLSLNKIFTNVRQYKFTNYSHNVKLYKIQHFSFAKKRKESGQDKSYEKELEANLRSSNTLIDNKELLEKEYVKSTLPQKEKINKVNKEGKIDTNEKFTAKILCEIIGSKYYPTNEDIKINSESLVTVYDENDKLIGTMSFGIALTNAYDLKKDIILRNDKVNPPIVKMMKYKIELVKRLLKKLGKNFQSNLGEKEHTKTKFFLFSLKSDKKDYDSKVDKLRQLLAENNNVKAIISCDIDDQLQSAKAISILKNVAQDVNELAKLRAGPVKQKSKKTKYKPIDPSLSDPIEEIQKHDKVIKDAYSLAEITEINSENDLEYLSSIYIDLESLIVDNTGVDYEKLLESSKIESIIKGFTHTNVVEEINTQAAIGNSPPHREFIQEKLYTGISKANALLTDSTTPIQKQIEMLEKEVKVQGNLREKFKIQQKIEEMKEEIKQTHNQLTFKAIKKKMNIIAKNLFEQSGITKKDSK